MVTERYPLGYGPSNTSRGGHVALLTTRSRRFLSIESAEATLRTLGIELPEPPKPVASYVPVQQVGELLYTSGVIPTWNGERQFHGVVGADITVKDAARAAEICALNIMALVRQHTGSLDQVEQVIQLSGFVRSAAGFEEQPKVLNGASDLIYKVFGERGRHTRQALGTSELPFGVPVEISAIIRLKR